MKLGRTPIGLQTATTTRALSAGRVSGYGGDIFDSSYLQADTGEGSEGGLGARTGGLGSVTTSSSHLDVHSGDAEGLDLLSDVLGGKHSSVGGRLITISLDLHAASDSAQGLTAGKIGDVL